MGSQLDIRMGRVTKDYTVAINVIVNYEGKKQIDILNNLSVFAFILFRITSPINF